MGLGFCFFIAALGVALSGMQTTENQLGRFIEEDQTLLLAVTNMYAQGLQMGQALRNVVIDPRNKTGYKNLEDAGKGFEEHASTAQALVAADPDALQTMRELAALRERQKGLQAEVIAYSHRMLVTSLVLALMASVFRLAGGNRKSLAL